MRFVPVSLIVAVAFTAPAAAAPGNGLYEPYPTPVLRSSVHYYAKLGLPVGGADVLRGAFGRGLRAVPSGGAPSIRAGMGDIGGGGALLAFALAASAAIVALPRLIARRGMTGREVGA